MDLNLISSKLEQLQQSKPGQNNNQKFDRSQYFWKAPMGKTQIRFVPFKENKENPFSEVYFHYGIGNRTMLSPINYGEKDPIVEFSKELRKTSEPENWRLAKKLEPKMRVFAPVVVRGEENKGVRFWEFGKQIYQELLSYAADEDYGDFTDVSEGFDFVVTATKVQDRPGFQLGLRPKPKQTQLSEDASQVETWLENQPVLLEERYKYTYDKLKEELQNFLTEDVNNEDSIVSEPASEFDGDTKTVKEESKFSLSTQGAPKKAKSEEFDSLFEDDGLPF